MYKTYTSKTKNRHSRQNRTSIDMKTTLILHLFFYLLNFPISLTNELVLPPPPVIAEKVEQDEGKKVLPSENTNPSATAVDGKKIQLKIAPGTTSESTDTSGLIIGKVLSNAEKEDIPLVCEKEIVTESVIVENSFTDQNTNVFQVFENECLYISAVSKDCLYIKHYWSRISKTRDSYSNGSVSRSESSTAVVYKMSYVEEEVLKIASDLPMVNGRPRCVYTITSLGKGNLPDTHRFLIKVIHQKITDKKE